MRRKKELPMVAKKINAARALYISEDIQRIEMKIDTSLGEKVIIELTAKQCFDLMGELAAAYNAINPPLNPSRFNTTEG